MSPIFSCQNIYKSNRIILLYYYYYYSLTSPYGHLYNTDTSLLRTVRLVPECQKSYTSVKRTLGSVPLVSVLKRFDCTTTTTTTTTTATATATATAAAAAAAAAATTTATTYFKDLHILLKAIAEPIANT